AVDFCPEATFALRGSSGCIEQEKTVCSGLRSVPGGGRVLAWVGELANAGSGPALIRRGTIFRAYPVDAQTHNCLRTGKKLRSPRPGSSLQPECGIRPRYYGH